MTPQVSNCSSAEEFHPRVLVVDDEPMMTEVIRDLVAARLPGCNMVFADSVAQAERVMATQKVDLLLTDVYLPDGNGLNLLPSLRKQKSNAAAIVITGNPTVDGAITAIRNGAVDFIPKPFTSDHLADRVKAALTKQSALDKQDKKIDKLKSAVRKLNDARKLVSKKVDLLCNDLVTAYGELSRQMDDVRTQEGFRKFVTDARDLEQLLCHAMDWLLRELGYSNVAIWLAGEDGKYQLGAYMKYTTPGDNALTEALKRVLLPTAVREGFLNIEADTLKSQLSKEEYGYLEHQTITAVNCTYLGESLACLVFFRDSSSPFTEGNATTLQTIGPIFANALASVVKDVDLEAGHDGEAPDHEEPIDPKDNKKNKRDRRDDDWWKRGEPPPF